MCLLDTDHLSVLERGGEAALRLRGRLQNLAPDDVAVSIVSYEEQSRGWLSFLAKVRLLEEQTIAYGYLQQHLQIFCTVPLLAFDLPAVAMMQQLQRQRIRIGTLDLKIASIALAQDATLLSRNTTDFAKIPGLRVEDWTA